VAGLSEQALGIFGGTFDPPHIGHLILAADAQAQLGLARVLFVLTPNPPHKAGRRIRPVAQRLALLQAALDDDPSFELSRVDIDRPPPHYAVDTVSLLREQKPGVELVYLMGGDSLADLPTWHRPQEFVLACDAIGVMCRPGRTVDLEALESKLPGLKERVRFIQAPMLEISSSELRQRMAERQTFRYYLPPAVYQLILKRGLYGITRQNRG
jgi:nicotinate-nucleotide adenylyltransferase